MTPAPSEQHLAWVPQGTAFFKGQLDRLDDSAIPEPSRLPGWSRAHVVTHLARNADALVNLIRWASTGVVSPMYTSPEQRNADIEAGARRPAPEIRDDLDAAVDRLASEMAAAPDSAWEAEVRSARGRPIPSSEIPWMRVREVWIHGVDLDGGASFADFPDDLQAALIEDVAGGFAGRDDCPDLVVVARDLGQRWPIGRGVTGPEVEGDRADLLGWLLGRETGDRLRSAAPDGRPPALPAWL